MSLSSHFDIFLLNHTKREQWIPFSVLYGAFLEYCKFKGGISIDIKYRHAIFVQLLKDRELRVVELIDSPPIIANICLTTYPTCSEHAYNGTDASGCGNK